MLRKVSNYKIKFILIVILMLGTICYLFLFWFPVSSGGNGAQTVIKAKQTEAEIYLQSMNRSQRAYRIEHGFFATDITALGIGMPEQTDSYVYSIRPSEKSDTQVTHLVVAKQPGLRSYVGEVAVISGDATVEILCESEQSSQIAPLTPKFVNNSLACAPGSRELK
jgi:type II secretory pathway pseudopilin PulG